MNVGLRKSYILPAEYNDETYTHFINSYISKVNCLHELLMNTQEIISPMKSHIINVCLDSYIKCAWIHSKKILQEDYIKNMYNYIML
jgi:hypothetical protein